MILHRAIKVGRDVFVSRSSVSDKKGVDAVFQLRLWIVVLIMPQNSASKV